MDKAKSKDRAIKVLAGIGLVVVLAMAGWAGTQVIRMTPNILSGAAGVFSNFLAVEETPEFMAQEILNDGDETKEPVSGPVPDTSTPTQAPLPQTVVVEGPQLPQSNPNGTADLKITLIETGIVDSSGNFTSMTDIPKNDRAAIKFVVENIGDKQTGSWKFLAVLPGVRTTRYTSDNQVSLLPTQDIEFVIGFDKPSVGVEDYSIEVDPSDSIAELSESNNKIESTILVVN